MEKSRFSLLLLEPGEMYLEDFSSVYLPSDVPDSCLESNKQLGRLKMCSKSLVFDPQELSKPVLKIQLKDCTSIKSGKKRLSNVDNDVIDIECMTYAEMLQGNVIAPYNFKHVKTRFLFLLNYAKVDDCLPQILQLYRASTLLPPEQNSMIAAIAFSRQSRLSFNPKWLEDMYETVIYETEANKISPLVVNPGKVVLTTSIIYFQPNNNIELYPVLKVHLKDITRIICRRFLLKHVGLEIYSSKSNAGNVLDHIYLVLKSPEDRDRLYNYIMEQPKLTMKMTEQEIMTLKWQNRALSTYDYLLYLNSLADRSFNDLTQYPVFPWVLSDYTSDTLDLSDPKSFRDLTKPIGAINQERLRRLKERCREMPDPKFLYGSHYSAPGFILFYLIRKYPHYMLCLQNGRFDHPDRIFHSIADVWRNVNENMSDFKELIPEFYDVSQSGDFLINSLGTNFGFRHDGTRISDVKLPPWASNAQDFVSKLRDALESNYVSDNIHHWIDLIFGHKQRGREAELADNVYYYLCYEGAVDVDTVYDLNQRYALEVQIMEFGQIPKQIFKVPHPQRHPPMPSLENSMELGPNDTVSKSLEPNWNGIDKLDKKHVLTSYKENATAVAISKDNKLILSCAKNSPVKLHSTANMEQMRTLRLSPAGIASCTFLPDNKTIVLGTFDDTILICDIDFGKIIDSIKAHDDTVSSVSWGESSQYLVTASLDCSVMIWKGMFHNGQWHKLRINSSVRFDVDSPVTCCCISSDCRFTASGTKDGDLVIWDVTSNVTAFKKNSHAGSCVQGVSFSPDNSKLVSCGADGNFKVFDLLTSMEVYSKCLQYELTCLAWDGFTLVIGSNSGKLFFWDLVEVKLLKEEDVKGKVVTCISASGDGSMLVTGEDKMVVLHT